MNESTVTKLDISVAKSVSFSDCRWADMVTSMGKCRMAHSRRLEERRRSVHEK